MFVTSYTVTFGIYIPGNREFVFISIVRFMMSANSRIRVGLQIVSVYLYITQSHYHHCGNFIWRHWTYKMPFRYNLSSVWVRLSIFSQLSIIRYVGLCVFSLPISFVMIERIYILCLIIIIIKSEVWTIVHYLGLGHETMVCGACLSIFLWRFWYWLCCFCNCFSHLILCYASFKILCTLLCFQLVCIYDQLRLHVDSRDEFIRIFRIASLTLGNRLISLVSRK